MTQDGIISYQFLKGGVGSELFDNFIYETISRVKSDPRHIDKEILVFMDNAVIHKTPDVANTVSRLGAHLLFNA
jgi:hypothetical protein